MPLGLVLEKQHFKADKSTLFVSPKPGAARAVCAAHRLRGCAGAKVPAPSLAPAAATNHGPLATSLGRSKS